MCVCHVCMSCVVRVWFVCMRARDWTYRKVGTLVRVMLSYVRALNGEG